MAPTLTPFARKIITYLTLAFGCLVVIRYGISSPTRDNSSSKHWSILINDPKLQLRGLIHVLKTYPDQDLPEVEDGALLTPYALGVTEYVTPKQWAARILKTEKETPLTVFSKTYCPYSKAAKALLTKYDIHPPPFIVEADLRNDTMRLKSYLGRLTGHSTFPNVIMNSKSYGGSSDINQMHANGELKGVLKQAGLVVKGNGH
ncbi:hypothetical protein FRB94_008827 [Tulasnella sp. JGI-2019a]|nr:hypothetical protein FRB93_012910 [Tulasnella sp. JGI-2019a]KAG9011227.1 hypothetical protein FRB94_008827 [Tulasnella sp. JGI-2019a]KAG9035328.1 hypothetical protein FRB95_011478 [Tulasnella sp. JGI-2019a]